MTDTQKFLIYQSADGSTRIDVMLEAETLWLSQKQLTELFGKAKGTISEHIKQGAFRHSWPDCGRADCHLFLHQISSQTSWGLRR